MEHHPVLLCLHGWGGSKESFTELREALAGTAIDILSPDLPGFGEEPEPKLPWTNDDYVTWISQWIEENVPKERTLFLLGHSHGGRIIIKLMTSKERPMPVTHLFLCAPAGIRHPRHFKRIVGLILAKTGKFFLSVPGIRSLRPLGKKLLYRLVRVHDYENASDIMRQTLINVSREDLRPRLRDIAVPVDLFWGREDGMTPYRDALIMDDTIPESILHSYDHVRHGVHRDRASEIADVIRQRI